MSFWNTFYAKNNYKTTTMSICQRHLSIIISRQVDCDIVDSGIVDSKNIFTDDLADEVKDDYS